MNLCRPALALCIGGSTLAGCTLDNGTGTPDPGLYWRWECPEGGTPLDASAPIDYVASGSCGMGGPFVLSVDGCEIFGSWSALGLSNVQTVQYTSSPGLGGWIVTATEGSADGGASWVCTANPAAAGALTFACSDATDAATSSVTCQSALTPVPDAGAEPDAAPPRDATTDATDARPTDAGGERD
jgi:hypothetical protein